MPELEPIDFDEYDYRIRGYWLAMLVGYLTDLLPMSRERQWRVVRALVGWVWVERIERDYCGQWERVTRLADYAARYHGIDTEAPHA